MDDSKRFTHGLRGEIIYSPHGAANGGISESVQSVTVVGPDIPRIDPVTGRAPAVVIAETTPGYTVLRPAEDPAAGLTSYMASGNYVAPKDSGMWRSVFGTHGAIPLHDYTETWAQYDRHGD